VSVVNRIEGAAENADGVHEVVGMRVGNGDPMRRAILLMAVSK
jgi:hypothetical protein